MKTQKNVAAEIKTQQETAKISEKVRKQLFAEFRELQRAEAEAAAAALLAEAEERAKAEAEAAAKAKEAAKAEAAAIRKNKREANESILNTLLDYKTSFNYAIEILLKGEESRNKYMNMKQQKSFNLSQFNELVKSINLSLKQFSDAEILKYVSDGRYVLPATFITAILRGACKSEKAFLNSKTKELPAK